MMCSLISIYWCLPAFNSSSDQIGASLLKAYHLSAGLWAGEKGTIADYLILGFVLGHKSLLKLKCSTYICGYLYVCSSVHTY